MSCKPQPWANKLQIPNCDDPVFRAWCAACDLIPGGLYDYQDVRIAQLERFMHGRYDPTYDPEADTADDYLTEGF